MDDSATRKELMEPVREKDLSQTSSVSPSPVTQQPTVPQKTYTNVLSNHEIDGEIVQQVGDTMKNASNAAPNLGLRNNVPLQPNIVTMNQLMNNPVDNNSVMSYSDEMDLIKNDPGITDETKELQQHRVEQNYYDDLLILEKGSTNVDVTNSQYYNTISYEMPVPTAPTLEAIYGSSVPHTDCN